jgi:metallo-beta-lactamase family protein
MATIKFLGAAGTVTGSMHVLEVNGRSIALDCGLFQGRRAESEILNADLGGVSDRLSAVILSHSHIDHSGRLPLLVKHGFNGPIYSTPAAHDLSSLMLADSAHIQEENVRYLNKKRSKNGEKPLRPLYGRADASAALSLFHTVPYGRTFPVVDGVSARLLDAGHILGSAMVQLFIDRPNAPPASIVFSGDIGRPDAPILRDPHPKPDCDYLICESTYGGRRHGDTGSVKDRLAEVVKDTFSRNGKVIIPAFSVGRTQNILYSLHELIEEGVLPQIPIFVDSPLAINATHVFTMHPQCYDFDAMALFENTGNLFCERECTFTRTVEASKRLNKRRRPCVIISSSGMCEHGRILHHLKNAIRSDRNTILIVSYCAPHTLGRRLVEQQEYVTIFGDRYKRKARVVTLNGLSQHADADELDGWLRPGAEGVQGAFLVHGDPDQTEKLRSRMLNYGYRRVEMPSRGQSFPLEI